MPRRKWWILGALGVGTFMSALDGSIVNVILPVVQRDLHTSLDTVQWVVTIYLLVISGLLLTFGRLGDLVGHRPVCLLGFLVFIIGSALCGFAPTIFVLVAARAFQALGAAMIFSSSPAILTANFPPVQLGQALGLQAAMTYLGLACGPSLGGWLTDSLGWQSVFFASVPVGALAIIACRWAIPITPPVNRDETFDPWGAVAFLIGVSMLLLALNQGHAWGWASMATLSLLGGSVLVLTLFVQIERRVRFAMLDLTLFRSTLFSAAIVSAGLNYSATAMVLFLMPFYLIAHLGWDPQQAGLLLTAQPLVMSITAPISGSVSDWLDGSRWVATTGMAILTLGLGWLAYATHIGSWQQAAAGLAVVGLGTGVFNSPNNSALMSAAPPNRRGIAGGVMATGRNVGVMFGVALAGAVGTTMQALRYSLPAAITASFCVAAFIAALGTAVTLVRGKPSAR